MTKPMWLSVPVLGTMLLLTVGCPAPPMDAGPPPTPDVAMQAETVSDSSDESPAPVLPDPRSELPDVSESDAGTSSGDPTADTPTMTMRPADQTAGGVDQEVYSVQVFAATSRDNAEAVAQRVRGVTPSEVEVVAEADGIFRVYAGTSASRDPIDRLRDELRDSGFGDSWTRQRSVRVSAVQAPTAQPDGAYSVQVFASDSEESARRVVREVSVHTTSVVDVVRVGDLWKVLVGRSDDRASIDLERDRLRAAGYSDAWTLRR